MRYMLLLILFVGCEPTKFQGGYKYDIGEIVVNKISNYKGIITEKYIENWKPCYTVKNENEDRMYWSEYEILGKYEDVDINLIKSPPIPQPKPKKSDEAKTLKEIEDLMILKTIFGI